MGRDGLTESHVLLVGGKNKAVRGHWTYLYRAVDKARQTIDFRTAGHAM
jgi:hypothetical protein